MPAITPFLWFSTQAEEAMHLYTSVFKRSRVTASTGSRDGLCPFELEGQRFVALNGNPDQRFTEATSFFRGLRNPAGDRRVLD